MRKPWLLLVVALSAVSCGGSNTPTSPSGPPTTATERFDAIIVVKGSNFQPFSVGQSGASTTINLASLSSLTAPGVLLLSMQIGYGTTVLDDDGNVAGCDVKKTVQATPSLTAQLSDSLTPAANYCATITDIGNLKEAANFSVRITHP